MDQGSASVDTARTVAPGTASSRGTTGRWPPVAAASSAARRATEAFDPAGAPGDPAVAPRAGRGRGPDDRDRGRWPGRATRPRPAPTAPRPGPWRRRPPAAVGVPPTAGCGRARGPAPAGRRSALASRCAPVEEELVGAVGAGGGHRAGDGEHRHAASGGLHRRAHRPARGLGLHHHDDVGQGRDEPVPGRELPGGGRRARAGTRSAPRRTGRPRARGGRALAGRCGRGRCRPPRSGGAPPPTRAPAWAAPSMPRARPETTAMPDSARRRPSSWATSRP